MVAMDMGMNIKRGQTLEGWAFYAAANSSTIGVGACRTKLKERRHGAIVLLDPAPWGRTAAYPTRAAANSSIVARVRHGRLRKMSALRPAHSTAGTRRRLW